MSFFSLYSAFDLGGGGINRVVAQVAEAQSGVSCETVNVVTDLYVGKHRLNSALKRYIPAGTDFIEFGGHSNNYSFNFQEMN